MPVNYETLLCEVKEQVARVTLNRPEVLNALNARVFNELEQVFMTLVADMGVRVVLLTGAGEKAFAAGADINEIARLDVATGEAKARRGQEVFRMIETCGKPVIACINGLALGGGCELAMACTMRLASEAARDGATGGKAGACSGVWRDAAAAEAGGAVDGAEVAADRGDDRGSGGAADRAGG